jgi:hypothetical protein
MPEEAPVISALPFELVFVISADICLSPVEGEIDAGIQAHVVRALQCL